MLFELYSAYTQQVEDVQEMTQEEANVRNTNLRDGGIDWRWIPQRELPSSDCTCGAETKVECVCNF